MLTMRSEMLAYVVLPWRKWQFLLNYLLEIDLLGTRMIHTWNPMKPSASDPHEKKPVEWTDSQHQEVVVTAMAYPPRHYPLVEDLVPHFEHFLHIPLVLPIFRCYR